MEQTIALKGKLLRAIELVTLFIGIPIAYYYDLFPFHKIIPLILGALYTIALLVFDKSFNRQEIGLNGFNNYKHMLMRSICVFIILVAATYLIAPDQLFFLPQNATWLWAVIMLMYPVWSVIPQELIYRTFFFHRYQPLFPSNTAMIIASGVAFAFMHIIFENIVALVFSLAAGIILSIIYSRHRSLLGISLEHAIYGNMVFTTGLGTFFYIN